MEIYVALVGGFGVVIAAGTFYLAWSTDDHLRRILAALERKKDV